MEVSYFCTALNSLSCCLTKMKKEVKRKRQTMKKKLILALTLSVFGIASYAFAPSVPVPPARTYSVSTPQDNTNQVKGPLAPATLLLLGLAGSFAGVKIYHNNKKEE